MYRATSRTKESQVLYRQVPYKEDEGKKPDATFLINKKAPYAWGFGAATARLITLHIPAKRGKYTNEIMNERATSSEVSA